MALHLTICLGCREHGRLTLHTDELPHKLREALLFCDQHTAQAWLRRRLQFGQCDSALFDHLVGALRMADLPPLPEFATMRAISAEFIIPLHGDAKAIERLIVQELLMLTGFDADHCQGSLSYSPLDREETIQRLVRHGIKRPRIEALELPGAELTPLRKIRWGIPRRKRQFQIVLPKHVPVAAYMYAVTVALEATQHALPEATKPPEA